MVDAPISDHDPIINPHGTRISIRFGLNFDMVGTAFQNGWD